MGHWSRRLNSKGARRWPAYTIYNNVRIQFSAGGAAGGAAGGSASGAADSAAGGAVAQKLLGDDVGTPDDAGVQVGQQVGQGARRGRAYPRAYLRPRRLEAARVAQGFRMTQLRRAAEMLEMSDAGPDGSRAQAPRAGGARDKFRSSLHCSSHRLLRRIGQESFPGPSCRQSCFDPDQSWAAHRTHRAPSRPPQHGIAPASRTYTLLCPTMLVRALYVLPFRSVKQLALRVARARYHDVAVRGRQALALRVARARDHDVAVRGRQAACTARRTSPRPRCCCSWASSACTRVARARYQDVAVRGRQAACTARRTSPRPRCCCSLATNSLHFTSHEPDTTMLFRCVVCCKTSPRPRAD